MIKKIKGQNNSTRLKHFNQNNNPITGKKINCNVLGLWKRATVIPIPKLSKILMLKNSNNDPLNYRAVALNSCFLKSDGKNVKKKVDVVIRIQWVKRISIRLRE